MRLQKLYFLVFSRQHCFLFVPMLRIVQNMLKIAAGSTIYFEGTYDNTINNPFNPYHPPRDIPESIRTKDEMLQLWIDFLPYKEGDERISLEVKK